MKCPSCSYICPAEARFCSRCGSILLSEVDPIRAPAVKGEFKHATILFVDIVASTELVASLDPEQAMERLGPALALMRRKVEQFGGTVAHGLGDGIMALFGAPRTQEGHALLACRAALGIQDAFPRTQGGVLVRVGLHSGTVVFDLIEPDLIHERGAYGVAIHLASRLQLLAEPGGICISDDCYQLVRPYCKARFIGRHRVRGLPEKVGVYELLNLRPAVASQQFLGVTLTTFRGRDREMTTLQRALRTVEMTGRSFVGISGPPGSGKSRLCFEFAEWCRGRLIPVFEARAQLYGHATPLQAVLEIMRLFFGILPTDNPVTARSRISSRLAHFGPEFESSLSLVYEFLGIADGGGASSGLAPKTRHARLLDVIHRLVRDSGSTTSVIIIEDLHWLDEASEPFLAALCDAVVGTQILLVLNYRPTYAASWMDRPHFVQLALAELNSIEAEELVEELIGARSGLAELRQRVAERSGGNPFFAEELVRSLAENGFLIGRLGDYRPGVGFGGNPLPVSVQAVIGDRLDRLADDERNILQVASIIGKEVPYAVLERVVDTASVEIDASLSKLCEAELLQIQPSNDGRWYAFRHPLIQEVAYAGQLRSRRSALHASVARVFQSYYRERLDEFAGLLSYHYEAAGRFPDAADYAVRAAQWVGSMHPAQAIKHWRDVRRLLNDQPRSSSDDAMRAMASSQIAWLGWREGMTADHARPFIQEALTIAGESDAAMIPLLLFVEARISGASGGSADAYVAKVKEALALVEGGTDPGRAATLYASLSQAYGWGGLLHEALAANDEAMARLPHVRPFESRFLGFSVEHWTISLRARIFVLMNRLDEGRVWLDRMLAIEDGLIDPTVQFISHLGYVDLAWIRGDAELGARHAARVADMAKRHGTPYLRVFAFACSGTAKCIAGDSSGAIRDFKNGLDFLRSAKAAVDYEPDMLASLAECHARAGHYGEANAVAKLAIEVARARTSRLAECRALIVAGSSLLGRHGGERAEEAQQLFERAEALVCRTGAASLEPLLLAGRERLMRAVAERRRTSSVNSLIP
jgi:class 3 adenylate cyclase